jgi:hypothetical protein
MGTGGWQSWRDKLLGTNGGIVASASAAVSAIVATCAFLYPAHDAPLTSSTSGDKVAGQHSSVPQPTASASPTRLAQASNKAQLAFYKLYKLENVGKVVKTTLTGTVPSGEHLWLFVCHLKDCYVQGTPWLTRSHRWYLPTVNLGSASPSDINSRYTIRAVLADSRANRAIQAAYKRTGYGNYGLSKIPGGTGARAVAHVTLYRDH